MKRSTLYQISLKCFLSSFLFFLISNSLAQNQSICSGFYFLPISKNKKIDDSTCTLIENGFMYTKAEQIIKLSGLPMNFIICKTNRVNNAFAFQDKNGNRFIKYDQAFMKKLNGDSTSWENMLILAHEIGHHIFSHSVIYSANTLASDYILFGESAEYKKKEEQYAKARFKQELEADRFAGFIMAKIGIRFEQTVECYRKLDKYYNGFKNLTHPPIGKRIEALKEGFDQINSAFSNQPLNLIKFVKEKPELVFNNPGILEHNKSIRIARTKRDNLINKILDNAIHVVANLFTVKTYAFRYTLSTKLIYTIGEEKLNAIKEYLGKNIIASVPYAHFEDEKDYLELYTVNFVLVDAVKITYDCTFMFHIREDYFYIVLFDPVGTKVAYKEKFSVDRISLEVIKNLFNEIFTLELQKVIDDKLK